MERKAAGAGITANGNVRRIPLSCGRGLVVKNAAVLDDADSQFRRAAFEVPVTNQFAIALTLERARGLLSYLADNRQECEPQGPGATQLRNMVGFVTSIEAWVVSASDDFSNAVKRLRDFSNTIERLQVPPDCIRDTRGVRLELIETFRDVANQLDAREACETPRC